MRAKGIVACPKLTLALVVEGMAGAIASLYGRVLSPQGIITIVYDYILYMIIYIYRYIMIYHHIISIT